MADDKLLDELLATPIGPLTAPKSKPDDFRRELEITGTTATATINGPEGTVNEGTALRYLQDEGLTPEEWQVTHFKKIEYGNPAQPYESVKFSFKRVVSDVLEEDAISPEVVAGWRAALQITDRIEPEVVFGASGTYSIKIADPQFGKKRTDEAIENYKRGVLAHLAAADSLSYELTGIHLAWMGDETENVVNSYGNQPHTIELNRTQQLELDYDMRVWTIKKALELGLPVSGSSVISNHGEWTRNGGKEPVTTQGDNASTYIARQVKSLFDELEPFTGNHIDWTIGGGSPGVTINLSGVDTYFSHGYIEKGRGGSTEIRTKSAIERQILGKTDELASVKLWFMAHYHHFYSNEFEGRTLFGCPAIEAERSSEYMLDQFGVWSPPGVLGLVITDRLSRGWAHLNVF